MLRALAKALPRGLSLVAGSALDLLYPRHCYHCGKPLDGQASLILCRTCFQELASLRIRAPLCARCGLPLAGDVRSETTCLMCQQRPPRFDLARAFFPYGSPIAPIIRTFKFHNEFFLGPMVAERVVKLGWMPPEIQDVDAIVPVPLHPRRRRERGYDQALLLAAAFARSVNLPLIADALKRTRYTSQQARLTVSRRRENVRGAFAANAKRNLCGLRLLLVDDVMTTGATAGECAKVLKKAGAAKVSVLTLARTTP